MAGRGRRRKRLLDDLQETKSTRKLKEKAVDRTLFITPF